MLVYQRVISKQSKGWFCTEAKSHNKKAAKGPRKLSYRVSIAMGVPQKRCLVYDGKSQKRMIFGGTPMT